MKILSAIEHTYVKRDSFTMVYKDGVQCNNDKIRYIRAFHL